MEKTAFPVKGSFCKERRAAWLKFIVGTAPEELLPDKAIERVAVVLGEVSGVEEESEEELVLSELDLAGPTPEETVEPDEEVSANARSCRDIVRICVIINKQDMIL